MSLHVFLTFPVENCPERHEVYCDNITSNLVSMAKEAGAYEVLWRHEEIGLTKASQLINPLRESLHLLLGTPEYFKTFNPPNGWGDYEGLVKFVRNYLNACHRYPEADVHVSR